VKPGSIGAFVDPDAMSEEALRNELLARNFEVKSVKAKKNFNQIELTPQRRVDEEGGIHDGRCCSTTSIM